MIAHDFTSSITGYVSHNLGFKSGNYNPNSVTNPPVRPELLEATEVGLKSELLDRKLRFNLSAFHYDYTDIQVRSNAGLPPGSVSVALNVASARTNGFEAQIDYKPVPGLSLNGGFAYLDAKYASYPGATCTTPRALTATVLGGLIGATCNLAGFPLPLSPKYSAALGFSYEIPTSIGPITWVANNSYKSRFTFTPDNTVQQGPINVIDTSIKWKSHDAKYDVQLFVKNATDKYRYVAGQAGSAYVYVPGEPRTFGLVVGYHM